MLGQITVETDVIYFTRRALEERLAAAKATNALVRQHHLQNAEGFEDLLPKSTPTRGTERPR